MGEQRALNDFLAMYAEFKVKDYLIRENLGGSS
jgi:hypothetical protein